MKNTSVAALAALTFTMPFAARAQTYTYDLSFGKANNVGKLTSPYGLTTDSSGNVYVADQFGSRIAKYDSSGNFLSSIGASGTAATGKLNSPTDVAFDSAGNMYVSDTFNYRVAEYDKTGSFLKSIGVSPRGTGNGQFNAATGLAVDSFGNLFVADQTNGHIVEFDKTGAFVQNIGTKGTGNGQVTQPIGLTLDGSGNLYVADLPNGRIVEFDKTGAFVQNIGTPGTGMGGVAVSDGQLTRPGDVTLDSSGNVYVADGGNNRIVEFGADGSFIQNIGIPGMGLNGAGTGDGQFNRPIADAFDSLGNLYVTDQGNGRIEKFTVSAAATPEPGAIAFLAAGMAGGAALLRRRRK